MTITSIRMPPGHATEGLEAARVIREELPGTAIIVLSVDVEVNEAMDLPVGRVVHRLRADAFELVGSTLRGLYSPHPAAV